MSDKTLTPFLPEELVQVKIPSNGFFPNNQTYPLLIYLKVFEFGDYSAKDVEKFLAANQWINSWVDGIYDYHHYHSNTHEVLVVFKGNAIVEIGGEKGSKYNLNRGDVIILPAGVAHKRISASEDFSCIGAYPFDVDYDMNYGKPAEQLKANKNIREAGLPAMDPIYGKNGLLFNYWK